VSHGRHGWVRDLSLDSQTSQLITISLDSHFVPNITFGHPVLEWVKKGNPDIFMDCHMMVSDPLRVSLLVLVD
jgi:pentose-5-phosphate-3-epimerase